MPSYALFLDDERVPSDVFWMSLPKRDWVIVRTVEEFERTLRARGRPDMVSFDNDLKTPKEGHHAAKLLCDACIDHQWELPQCFVHTQNGEGSLLIVSQLESCLKSWPELSGP